MAERWVGLAWIIAVVAIYAAAGVWLSLLARTVRELYSLARSSYRHSRPATTPAISSIAMAALVISVILAIACRSLSAAEWIKLLAAAACLGLGALAAWAALLGRSPDWRSRKAWRLERRDAYLHLALLSGAALFAAPFFWMVSTSLKLEKQVFTNPPVWIPHPMVPGNYTRTFQFLEQALPVGSHDGLLFLGNTLTIAGLSLVGALLSASMVGYAFARLRWPGRDLLFLVLLSTMMIPGAVTMIPQFMIFRSLGWIDTLRPLWVPSFFGGAFNVFLLRQFFLTLPNELEDAARLDGCGYWTIYWRILMPQIKPALAALAILQFMGAWNDFMGPLIYVTSPSKLPGSYALQLFQSAHGGEWTLLMCAATLWTLPVLLLFFFSQRQFIEGITLTGIKG